MADYGSSAGEIYAHTGQHLAEEITKAFAANQKKKDQLQGVQGALDIAKRFQLPDPKTGKLTNVFKDEHVAAIQHEINLGHAQAAAAQEAALGIGKGMVDRYQSSYAKAKMAAQGPITMTDAQGRSRIWDGKKWATDTAMPRNAMGQTPTTQMKLQQADTRHQDAQLNAARRGFGTSLKNMGISSPADLFDTNKHEIGTYDPQTGFESTASKGGVTYPVAGTQGSVGAAANAPAAPTSPPAPSTLANIWNAVGAIGGDPTDNTNAGAMGAYDPSYPYGQQQDTHVRIGYKPPVYSPDGKKIEEHGKPGTVISTDDLRAYQDASAQLAGPQAYQALQWLRNNPNSDLAPGVAKTLKSQIAKPTSPEASTQYSVGVAPQSAPSADVPVVPQSDTSGDTADTEGE